MCWVVVVVVDDDDVGDVVGVDDDGGVERSIRNAAPTKRTRSARMTPSEGW